jgi:hypothetical protein
LTRGRIGLSFCDVRWNPKMSKRWACRVPTDDGI